MFPAVTADCKFPDCLITWLSASVSMTRRCRSSARSSMLFLYCITMPAIQASPIYDCFVSLTLSAPVLSPREGICYLAIPIGYRMWTKERTKPELAGDFIVKMMSLMKSLPLYLNRLWSNLTAGRLNQAGPYAQGHWPCVFLQSVAAFIPIAWMRYCRGRPESLCPIRSRRRFPGQMATSGGPLRTEGFPKRRCQFESVAAERRI